MLSYSQGLGWVVVIVAAGRLPATAQNAGLKTEAVSEGVIVSFAPNRVSTSLHEPVVLHFSARNTLTERLNS